MHFVHMYICICFTCVHLCTYSRNYFITCKIYSLHIVRVIYVILYMDNVRHNMYG